MAEYDKDNDAYKNICTEVKAAQKFFDSTQSMLFDDFENLDINRAAVCKNQFLKIQSIFSNQAQNNIKIAETMEVIANKIDPFKDVENWFTPLIPSERPPPYVEYCPEPFKIIEIAKRDSIPQPDPIVMASLPSEISIVNKRNSCSEVGRPVGKISNLPPPPRMSEIKVQQSQVFALPRLSDLEDLKSEEIVTVLMTPKSKHRRYSITGLSKNKLELENDEPPVVGPRSLKISSPISPRAAALSVIQEIQEDETNIIAVGISLYNWNGEEFDDLPLLAGAKVELLDKSDPCWWRGRCNGIIGNFPSNYCTFDFLENHTDDLKSANGSNMAACQKIYKVLYDFDAENPEELTVREGDILHIRGEFTDWIVGNLPDFPDSAGLVPRNYCVLLA